MEKFKFLAKNKISQLPKTSGVYAFLARRSQKGEGGKKGAKLLYVGKALNIRERIKQHDELLGLAEQLGYIKTDSEIEALILEAQLIKRYQPKYNIVWKDDKNYFYVAVTKENFPQIFITHQPQLKTINYKLKTNHVGPFVDGRALKQTLQVLRKVFPYRTCNQLPKHGHACLWYQLQRCPAPCLIDPKIPGFEKRMKRDCQKNAENLITTLKQGKTAVFKKLTKEMKTLSEGQQFEQASRIRDQIKSLEKIISHSRIFESEQIVPRTSPWYYKRIEGYDISNIQGREATGAMVVFIDGKPDKSQYRQFKIKGEQKPNDIAMLKEVLERRFNHPEWPYPDLILTDGGKAQLNAALSIKRNPNFLRRGKAQRKFGFRVISLAKKHNELFVEGEKKPALLKTLPRETFDLILQLRDEAHRFAQRYHHHLRKKTLLG